MKWIDALKVYNAGKIWCVPRKNTPEYDEVKKIMNRTKPAEVEKRNVERREKAMEQLKELDTRKKIEERREKEAASRDAVKVLQDTKPRSSVDRIPDITEQIKEELKEGMVSFEYDLGWKPETKQYMHSGGLRGVKSDYRRLVDAEGDKIDVAKLKERKREIDTEIKQFEGQISKISPVDRSPSNPMFVDISRRIRYLEPTAKQLNAILYNLEHWKPMNAYYGRSHNYSTKFRNTSLYDGPVKQALDDYQVFADQVNVRRGNPIRNITVRERINSDGSRTLQASWDIQREQYTYPQFVRQYDILPVFRFREGTTLATIEEEERKEKEKEKAQEEKRAEKEKDPATVLKKEIEKVSTERNTRQREHNAEMEKKYGSVFKRDTLPKEVRRQADKDQEDFYRIYEGYALQIRKMEAELKALKKQKK